jgi:CRISPR-associated exonuclease Cas4
MNEALFIIPLLLIAAAIVRLVLIRRRREALQIPSGEPIYLDTEEQPGTTLFSHRLRLKGRPDFLFQRGDMIIPVEAKTGSTPRQPHLSHVMQLIAYCVLVEENYGQRPLYGVIRYPQEQFEIAFTPEREAELVAILREMWQKKREREVHRNHTSAQRCAACGFRRECEERLDVQTALPFEV